jgi:hypothetical protein
LPSPFTSWTATEVPRRQQVLELVLECGGLHRGVQSRIAEVLGVHRSVISKDLKALLPLVAICPTCGATRPREEWDAGGPGAG